MTKKWYVEGDDGRLTLYDDENRAKNARRGSQSLGVLEMTTLPDAPSYYEDTPVGLVANLAGRAGFNVRIQDSPGCGTSCPCRSCQMKYHGGW